MNNTQEILGFVSYWAGKLDTWIEHNTVTPDKGRSFVKNYWNHSDLAFDFTNNASLLLPIILTHSAAQLETDTRYRKAAELKVSAHLNEQLWNAKVKQLCYLLSPQNTSAVNLSELRDLGSEIYRLDPQKLVQQATEIEAQLIEEGYRPTVSTKQRELIPVVLSELLDVIQSQGKILLGSSYGEYLRLAK